MLTRKDILDRFYYEKIFNLANCLEIKRYLQEIGSNAGIYGWNWSAYVFGGFCIIDSYRNSPAGKALEFTKAEQKKIKSIDSNWDLKFEQKQKKIFKLLEKKLEKIGGIR